MRHAATSALMMAVLVSSMTPASAAGPDVIIGFVDDGREESRLGNQVALTASTNACNIGDQPVNWHALPDKRHPAITLNIYRLNEGVMEQLAASWVKHGFYAVNADDCAGLKEVPMSCQPGSGGNRLRPGCSDLYSEDLNADPANLGPRSRIDNAANGDIDGTKAQDLTGYPTSSAAEKILLVPEASLTAPSARYFVEAHYIAADDAVAGNSRNNVTYREVKPVLRSGSWVLKNVSPETRLQPAITVWRESGATVSEIETNEGGVRTYVMVGSKATALPDGRHRYDYLVYNMNSELGFGGFSVAAPGAEAASLRFRSVSPGGEIWSTAPWTSIIDQGRASWTTASFATYPKANAIRWGTSYSFSFISTKPPATSAAVLTRFKTATAPTTQTVSTNVVAPGN